MFAHRPDGRSLCYDFGKLKRLKCLEQSLQSESVMEEGTWVITCGVLS